ncbi:MULTISPECIES: AAA family ATPase [Shewanella]|uniref:AAA family ATPase n=1 Tax=Shewanella fidelis TaxID=173509 RepID=A0AAW8NMU2_9GAMM|nr:MULTISPECIES: AAA family ATPase [Shewanella]MDR8524080.1 AAA family ATPase [Shewanella fidelis]MDW4810627.1 AAA family ATPase [Shewanella fidelis]MDW4814748.1 AAA family ATPase [Shewanella fidelis]MDW4818838.1 AAA family ATPase [Shewanella fidelis]MDW4823485.1 AAA family ATPase [Shewanella fidelis]
MKNFSINHLLKQLETVLIGKPQQIKLALSCILARGHLLIEDLPGMGKTSLSHGLAHCLGLSYQRVQFTSDMLPADILGVSIFNKSDAQFNFHPGPIFNQMILADEINRASPKTQSALLEAMAEQQITVDGQTYALPQPFFVIATQNPTEQSGTFPLPESQLDRFMMRISIGYPAADAELAMLKNQQNTEFSQLEECLSVSSLQAIQEQVAQVSASDSLLKYILALVNTSRTLEQSAGLSPRASIAILQAAKAWAFINERSYIVPEDVQTIFPHVAEHRIRQHSQQQGEVLSDKILSQVNPIL